MQADKLPTARHVKSYPVSTALDSIIVKSGHQQQRLRQSHAFWGVRFISW